MNKYPRWKYGLIIFLIVVGIVYALPNLYGQDPAVQISAHRSQGIAPETIKLIQNTLATNDLTYKSITEQSGGDLLIRFTNAESQLKAQDILKDQLGDDYTTALNLASTTPRWLTALGANPMKLGLDLQGGVHFLLAIDVDSLIQRRVSGDAKSIGDELRTQRIRYTGLMTTKDNTININFRDQADLDKAAGMIGTSFPDLQGVKSTQSNNGNYQLTLAMTPAALIKAQDYAVEQTTTILRNRVNELGVAEPIVQRQGVNRVSVDLPGVQDTARAKQILGGTATLEFKLMDTQNNPDQAAAGLIPSGDKLYQYEGRPVLLIDRVVLSGTSITGASSSVGDNGLPNVDIILGGGGEALFYRITGDNVGKPLAIVYVETKMERQVKDGQTTYIPRKSEKVINIATIQSALGNRFQITGLADSQEAQNLALLLRAGALPAPISIIEESTVGPSLGKENIKMGILSVEIGFILIVLFMMMYYRFMGFVADIALFLNLVFMMAALSIINNTLTLAGIAGIVLTVGMAVDANVLIFERVREELRNGLSPHAAIKAGYERAFSTIVDSNLTTLIAAIALAGIGTGSIKGFAVVLIIGLLTSMFTAITVTRAIIHLVYGNRTIKKLSIGI